VIVLVLKLPRWIPDGNCSAPCEWAGVDRKYSTYFRIDFHFSVVPLSERLWGAEGFLYYIHSVGKEPLKCKGYMPICSINFTCLYILIHFVFSFLLLM